MTGVRSTRVDLLLLLLLLRLTIAAIGTSAAVKGAVAIGNAGASSGTGVQTLAVASNRL